MQNFTTWNKKTFAGNLHDLMEIYSQDEGVHNNAINSVLFLTTVQEKYVKMYDRFLEELKLYSRAIRVLSKGHLKEVRIAITKSNKDYDLVLTRLYLYYGMKLVTFGIDNQRNLIGQFHVFGSAIHSEKTDYVSNWNHTSPHLRQKWTSTLIHRTENRKTVYHFKWGNVYNIAHSRTENV